MKTVTLAVAMFLAPAAVFAQSGDPAPAAAAGAAEKAPARVQQFWDDSVRSPFFYLRAVGAGIIDQWGGMPEEWQGGSGFAKREASRFVQSFAAEGIGDVAAAVLRQRVAYDPCTCTGVGRRIAHALSRAFVARSYDGHLVPNVPLFVAQYGSAALANAWYPPSYTTADVLTSGTIAFGASMGFKVFSEFTPEVRHLLGVR
jgi:hypothetical protein